MGWVEGIVAVRVGSNGMGGVGRWEALGKLNQLHLRRDPGRDPLVIQTAP